MPTVLAVGMERRAAARVVEEKMELSAGTEEPAAMEEARILVAETRIRKKARAAGIKNTSG